MYVFQGCPVLSGVKVEGGRFGQIQIVKNLKSARRLGGRITEQRPAELAVTVFV